MARLLAALACAALLPSLPLPAPAEPAAAVPAAAPEAQPEAQAEVQTEALAAKAQNPIANLISVPFQNNLTPGMGPNEDNTLNVLNIQPVVPFALSKDLTLVTRTILPVLSQPTPTGTQNGIGDLNPALVLPTASSDSLGSGKWSAGPAAVAVYSKGPWVAGAVR